MSHIAGFFHPFSKSEPERTQAISDAMSEALAHRGSCEEASLKHLHIRADLGLYNYDQLIQRLRSHNVATDSLSHAQMLLHLFRLYGEKTAALLRGSFAFAILDEYHQKLYLFRDPMGVKPLFYHYTDGTLIYATEIKGILAYPGVKAKINLAGMNELLSMGPAHIPGNTIYQDIYEVRPGHVVIYSKDKLQTTAFWQLQCQTHRESYEETVEHASFLLRDAIHRQLDPDDNLCCFLSGGLDSSIVTALVQKELTAGGSPKILPTFSFDFADSKKYFLANDFQPTLDRPYVIAMTESLHTNHTFLECDSRDQATLLEDAVIAHDAPCMADIASSLLHFCRLVAPQASVAFTGECADEIFAGYPWYHKERMLEADTFPWTMDLSPRQLLLRDDLLKHLHMEDYIADAYQACTRQVPCLSEDDDRQRLHRKQFVLTVTYFMQTLLDRMDRAGAHSGLEAKVPFADIPLVEYLYNVPWEMKTKDGEVKHLLRDIARPYLPESITNRRKSPYPKNYNPAYEKLLIQRFQQLLAKGQSPLLDFIDPDKVLAFCDDAKDYGRPWFGQLMAGPQLLAYYLQIDFWLRHYEVEYTTLS